MYEQIARNKRRAAIYVFVFFLVWLGIGALVGWIAAGASGSSGGSSYGTSNPTPTTTHYAGAVIAGMVIAGLLALAGIAFSMRSGSRLVLAVSGARPAAQS